MNEFVAKKLGEVLAFSRIGIECQQRAGGAFAEVLEDPSSFAEQLNLFADAVDQKANEVTRTKAEKTANKLRGMMESYIGDEWDNPTEILEWLSFFTGAATAHWSLISGAAQSIQDVDLENTANQALNTYTSYLQEVIEKLKENGQQRASS